MIDIRGEKQVDKFLWCLRSRNDIIGHGIAWKAGLFFPRIRQRNNSPGSTSVNSDVKIFTRNP